jgi:ABC-type multidrug transport system fused ATPase/permease subunit
LKRLNFVSRSPIFSHFGETLTGITTVRAYREQKRFVQEMYRRIDENLIFYYPEFISTRWIAVFLEFIGSLIILFTCLFAVIQRANLTGGQAGLSISYSLNVHNSFMFIL